MQDRGERYCYSVGWFDVFGRVYQRKGERDSSVAVNSKRCWYQTTRDPHVQCAQKRLHIKMKTIKAQYFP